MKNIFLLCLLFLSVTYLKSQTNLRYNLKQGDNFTIKQEVNQDISLTTEGKKQIINNKINTTFFYEVTGTSSDNYVIDMSFKSIHMIISIDGHIMINLDTESDSPDLMKKMYKGMLNKKVTVYMKPNGQVVDVQNGENIVNGVIEVMQGLAQNTIKDRIIAGLEKEYGGKTLSSTFEQMTYYYPSSPKSLNETWQNKFTGEGKINAANEWIYISESTDTRVIEGKADVTMNIDAGEIIMDLSGEQRTIAKIDPVSGFLKEIIVNTNVSGDSNSKQSLDNNMPATLKMNTTYTLQ